MTIRNDTSSLNQNNDAWKSRTILGSVAGGLGFAYATHVLQTGSENVGHLNAYGTRAFSQLITGTSVFKISTTKAIAASTPLALMMLGVVTAGVAAYSMKQTFDRYHATIDPTPINAHLAELVKETLAPVNQPPPKKNRVRKDQATKVVVVEASRVLRTRTIMTRAATKTRNVWA